MDRMAFGSCRALLLMGVLMAAGSSAFVVSPRASPRPPAAFAAKSLQRFPTLAATKSDTTYVPGTAKLDVAWEDLGFQFRPTRSHAKLVYKDGKWSDEPELVTECSVTMHIAATALHYGQACFEGLKAFCHADGSVHLFRPLENAHRMQESCRRVMMAELPDELFMKAVTAVVRDNLDYVPPYGSNGALYIRPVLIGTGARIGLQPADEYTFLCIVIPVGDYYRGGLAAPVKGVIMKEFDRAAPKGVGHVKVAGNYAADMLPNQRAKEAGYPIALYLDPKDNKNIEEFSTSNFVGISGNKYITPNSASVLKSITNKSLMQIAKDIGMTVEHREVHVEELRDMDEVLAVGTAVVVTPVGGLVRWKHRENFDEKAYKFGTQGVVGPVTRKLYDAVRAIQNGEAPDKHGWNVKVQ